MRAGCVGWMLLVLVPLLLLACLPTENLLAHASPTSDDLSLAGATNCYGTGKGDDQWPLKANLSFHRWHWGPVKESGYGGAANPGFVLGGLISISERNANGYCEFFSDSSRSAIAFIEAFHLAARLIVGELVAMDPSFDGVVSGLEIHDTCHVGKSALESSITMVNRPAATLADGGWCGDRIPIIVGPATSAEMLVTTSTLSTYQIPHITYWATSDRFENKADYPYMFRAVSSDQWQAEAMVAVIKEFNWKFVSVVGSDDEYGQGGVQAISRAVSRSGAACVHVAEEFNQFDVEQMKKVLDKLILGFNFSGPGSQLQKPNVVALICGPIYASRFFAALVNYSKVSKDFREKLNSSHIVWLASEGWISSVRLYELFQGNNSNYGTHSVIGFEPMVPQHFTDLLEDFQPILTAHLRDLNTSKETLQRNPWLVPVIEKTLGCSFSTAGHWMPTCDENLTVARVLDMKLSQLPTPLASGSLWLGVRTALYAIWNVYNSSRAAPTKLKGEDFRKMLFNAISCDHRAGCQVFEENQDTPPGYHVLSLEHDNSGEVSLKRAAIWQFDALERMGVFQCSKTSDTNLNNATRSTLSSCVTFTSEDKMPPTSTCSRDCLPGEYSKSVSAWATDRLGTCCWRCLPCTGRTYSNVTTDKCTECEDELKEPDMNHTVCVPRTAGRYAELTSILGLLPGCLAGVCLLVLLYTALVQPTGPKVEERGKHRNMVLLLSLALALSSVFTFLLYPSCISCSLSTILVPFLTLNSLLLLGTRSLHLVYYSRTKEGIPEWTVNLSKRFGHCMKANLKLLAIIDVPFLIFHVIWLLVQPRCPRKILVGAAAESGIRPVYLVCREMREFHMLSFLLLCFSVVFVFILGIAGRKACPPKVLGLQGEPNYILLSLVPQGLLLLVLFPSMLLVEAVVFPILLVGCVILQTSAVWFCILLPQLYSSGRPTFNTHSISNLAKMTLKASKSMTMPLGSMDSDGIVGPMVVGPVVVNTNGLVHATSKPTLLEWVETSL